MADEELYDPFGHGEFVSSRLKRIEWEQKQFELGCAVIEAARKVKRLQLDKSDGWTAAEQELVFAIEALDSEEE